MMQKSPKITPLRAVGNAGEDAVVAYLEKDGFAILARNFTVFGGEVDIIARKQEVLAFVEVKARTTAYFNLSEVMVPAKQHKIIKAARSYIFKHQLACEDLVYRFDVALLARQNETWDITYIPNAFTDMRGAL